MLAHKAEEDGVACVETMAGQAGHVDYDLVPGVIYTSPQGAGVGQTEEALKEAGVDYSKGKFAFSANGYARCLGETDGFVKVLADAKTDRILGVHILGPDAGTLIHEAVAVMAFGGAAEDVARICHAHPTRPARARSGVPTAAAFWSNSRAARRASSGRRPRARSPAMTYIAPPTTAPCR
jgi:dihydrolipoamide dehydrogenase